MLCVTVFVQVTFEKQQKKYIYKEWRDKRHRFFSFLTPTKNIDIDDDIFSF